MNEKEFISRDIKIMDLINDYPEVIPILMGYGLHCVGCHFSSYDTLEAGAKIHGMTDEIIEMMLKDVNLIIEKFHNAEEANKNID
jgi:hybrid cluster-associated redox disulfide protein